MVSADSGVPNICFAAQSLAATFQTIGKVLSQSLTADCAPEFDRIVDSLPVMLAAHGHSYSAKVALDVADAGYCAAKKTRFHGVRLHLIAARQSRPTAAARTNLALPRLAIRDSKAFLEQSIEMPASELFGDLAYPTSEIIQHLKEQGARLCAPKKKPKGGELTEDGKILQSIGALVQAAD